MEFKIPPLPMLIDIFKDRILQKLSNLLSVCKSGHVLAEAGFLDVCIN